MAFARLLLILFLLIWAKVLFVNLSRGAAVCGGRLAAAAAAEGAAKRSTHICLKRINSIIAKRPGEWNICF